MALHRSWRFRTSLGDRGGPCLVWPCTHRYDGYAQSVWPKAGRQRGAIPVVPESRSLEKKAGQDLKATLTERVGQVEAALATAQDDLALARKQAELAQKWANDQSRRPLVADSASACDKLDDLLTDTIKRRREQ